MIVLILETYVGSMNDGRFILQSIFISYVINAKPELNLQPTSYLILKMFFFVISLIDKCQSIHWAGRGDLAWSGKPISS